MKSRFTIAVLCFLLTAFFVNAGSYVHRVIIVNEGHYDYVNSTQTVPVTVGLYDPATSQYAVVDTIFGARFASNVIVDGSNVYVAADNQIIRYDADSYQRKATATVEGVRKLAVWNNQLLVSRGEYGKTFTAYFQVYDKTTLGFMYELPSTAGPQYASEGIIIKDNTAYVAINNGFDYGNEVGIIGKVDLNSQSYLSEIPLSSTARNPEGIYLEGGNIFTVNNNTFDLATIASVDLAAQTSTTTSLQASSGCGASAYIAGYVLYQISGDTKVGKFSTASLAVVDQLTINKNVYGMATDPINNLLYVGETDYTSTGKINIFDLAGNYKSSFDVSVSPGNITFDIRSDVGVQEPQYMNAFYAYPNPAKDQLTIVSNGNDHVLNLFDITGRNVMTAEINKESTVIDINSLSAGVYYLRSDNSEQIKIVKQ